MSWVVTEYLEPPAWTYSAEQWTAVERELPASADRELLRHDLEWFLTHHNRFWSGRLGRIVPALTLDGEIKERRKLIQAARHVTDAYKADLAYPDSSPSRRAEVLDHMKTLIAAQEKSIARLVAEKEFMVVGERSIFGVRFCLKRSLIFGSGMVGSSARRL